MNSVWGDNERYMFTRDVTLKALLRVFGDLVRNRKLVQVWEENRDPRAFIGAMRPWVSIYKSPAGLSLGRACAKLAVFEF